MPLFSKMTMKQKRCKKTESEITQSLSISGWTLVSCILHEHFNISEPIRVVGWHRWLGSKQGGIQAHPVWLLSLHLLDQVRCFKFYWLILH